MKLSNWY